MSNELYHTGTPQPYINQPIGSGRYRKGTGEHPNQHDASLKARVENLKAKGMNLPDIARALGFKSSQPLKDALQMERASRQQALRDRARFLHWNNNGRPLGWQATADALGIKNESTVRSWFKDTSQANLDKTFNTINMVREETLRKRYVDIGAGTAMRIGVTQNRLGAVVSKLVDEEGFHVEKIHVEQLGTGHQTTLKVLCAPDVDMKELNANRGNIKLIDNYSENFGRSFANIVDPVSIDPKRVYIRYAEENGKDKDGVMEIRRGVPDLSLGDADYAQVRIAVNNTHYLKGVAVYGDDKDIPEGYDIVFNTNKDRSVPMLGPKNNTVLKPLKVGDENPFGATIKNEEDLNLAKGHYLDPKTGEMKKSPLNIVNEQGEWDKWSKTLSSQFLAKQALPMAKAQLNQVYQEQKIEFDAIKQINNPVAKQMMLENFAEDCDSKAVYLKAAGLPRQASKLILPAPEIKPNEIVAPTYREGEHVVLIRFPHGGKFEIPELVVHNHGNEKALKMLGKGTDAVAIHPSAATRLSGADFDGDTVLVIPVNSRVKVDTIDPKTNDALRSLQEFDPGIYARMEGDTFKQMNKKTRGIEMGKVSNLITDMTLQRAPLDEIVRAVKHSMVVIDAMKHDYNFRQSEKDFRIQELRNKYQNGGGASTLISRARNEIDIPVRKEKYPSQMTEAEKVAYDRGEKIYTNTGETKAVFNEKTGEWEYKTRTTKIKQLEYYPDAYMITSGGSKETPGTRMEGAYAEHSNRLKALANEARKELRIVRNPSVSASAKAAYADEVKSLKEKYEKIQLNKPLERQANLIGNEQLKAWKKANDGNFDNDDLKKMKGQFQKGARYRVGKDPYTPVVTQREWEAIQAGAYPATNAKEILKAADKDQIRELAMPSNKRGISPYLKSRIKALAANPNNTQADIAAALGISTSTVSRALSGN